MRRVGRRDVNGWRFDLVRDVIKELAALGRFPRSEGANVDTLRQQGTLLAAIQRPLSPEEARILVGLFGPDTYDGLAWTLLHLVETTPGWPLEECLAAMESGEWRERMRERAGNGRR